MRRRLVIVQNRPTQFDMPLYARMQAEDWALLVFYSDADLKLVSDREIGRAPLWDHVPAAVDRGVYLGAEDRKNINAIATRIAAHQPELVILCGYYPRLHARLVGPLKRRGIKIGLRTDNTLPHGEFNGLKGLAKRLLLPIWLSRYDTWHPVGFLAMKYLEKMSLAKRPVFPFPYGVDVRWFKEQAAGARADRVAQRKSLGLEPGDFVVLGIMKWHPREDPMTLMRAFARLLKRHSNARLLMIGDGPLRSEVNKMARDIGAAVVLPGYQPYSKLPLFYALSDVFVHPSIDEPWGVSVQEALACSLPVLVASGVGARFDLLEDGVTGWTFAGEDDETLACRLSELADDAPLRQAMGAAAVASAHRIDYDYSLAQFTAAIEEVKHQQ